MINCNYCVYNSLCCAADTYVCITCLFTLKIDSNKNITYLRAQKFMNEKLYCITKHDDALKLSLIKLGNHTEIISTKCDIRFEIQSLSNQIDEAILKILNIAAYQ